MDIVFSTSQIGEFFIEKNNGKKKKRNNQCKELSININNFLPKKMQYL